MTPPPKRIQGFTLIELLVVIAIIGILAGFLAVGLPRALESAKIAKLDNTFLQIRNILTEYYVDHGTFPPAYGFLSPEARGVDPDVLLAAIADDTVPVEIAFFLQPWMAFVGQHSNEEMYDNFSIAYDTDRDGYISRLEYAPFGDLVDPAIQKYTFPPALYDPDNVPGLLVVDLDRQFASQGLRPIMYFPVNKRLFRKVAAEWFTNDSANPRPNDGALENGALLEQKFPPPNYDAYVLMSVGPTANTWGMVYDFTSSLMIQGEYKDVYYYHVLAMATYFMATRDAENEGEGDGELDFDFRARTRRGQAEHDGNTLPDPDGQNAAGPIIFVGEG